MLDISDILDTLEILDIFNILDGKIYNLYTHLILDTQNDQTC